ncbi:hypothetical protein LK12_03685 [Novosphingobium malaysiense]|uniref:Uncharacterized protein n=1 Tax=Novosphingobium malaysiense TaxID=1348853 RepID=A0A0B1ZS25_9SPHN|nr:hypothetical protein LK12_03685 [Novosphingobium malaysiense]
MAIPLLTFSWASDHWSDARRTSGSRRRCGQFRQDRGGPGLIGRTKHRYDLAQHSGFRRLADGLRRVMAMAMRTGAVLLRASVVIARLVMLFELRCDRGLSRAFDRFRHRCP